MSPRKHGFGWYYDPYRDAYQKNRREEKRLQRELSGEASARRAMKELEKQQRQQMRSLEAQVKAHDQARAKAAASQQARGQASVKAQAKTVKELAAMQQAQKEASVYAVYIEFLGRIHELCSPTCDWQGIADALPPEKPVKCSISEDKARVQLESYTPGFVDRLFLRIDSKRHRMARDIEEARIRDNDAFAKAQEAYDAAYLEWTVSRDLAKRVLQGDGKALLAVLREKNPFVRMNRIGLPIDEEANIAILRTPLAVDSLTLVGPSILEAIVHVGKDLIPGYLKRVLTSGKLSMEQLSQAGFVDLYAHFVCACVLRVARELFALLPLRGVLVTAMASSEDNNAEQNKEQPIVSVAIPAARAGDLHRAGFDSVTTVELFTHNMALRKTEGFASVAKLDVQEIPW